MAASADSNESTHISSVGIFGNFPNAIVSQNVFISVNNQQTADESQPRTNKMKFPFQCC